MRQAQTLTELNAQLGNKASEERDAFRFNQRERHKDYWTDFRVTAVVTHRINNRDEVGGRFSVY